MVDQDDVDHGGDRRRTRPSTSTPTRSRPSSTAGPAGEPADLPSPSPARAGRGRRHRRGRHGHAGPAVHPGGRLGRDPAGRLAPFGRPAAAGPRARRSRSGADRRTCSTASTWPCSTCPTRSRRLGAGRRRARRGGGGQLRRVPDGPRRAAGGARGQPGAPRPTGPRGIISNPNCTTLSMIVRGGRAAPGVRPARRWSWPPTRRRPARARPASTRSTRSWTRSPGTRSLGQRAGDVRAAVGDLGPFPAPLALNVVPWAGSLKADGWSSEELKIRNESRKILGLPEPEGLRDLRPGARGHHPLGGRARHLRPPVSREQARSEVLRTRAGRGGDRRPGNRRVPDPGRRGRHRPDLGGPGAPVARRPARRSSCSSAATTCARARR